MANPDHRKLLTGDASSGTAGSVTGGIGSRQASPHRNVLAPGRITDCKGNSVSVFAGCSADKEDSKLNLLHTDAAGPG